MVRVIDLFNAYTAEQIYRGQLTAFQTLICMRFKDLCKQQNSTQAFQWHIYKVPQVQKEYTYVFCLVCQAQPENNPFVTKPESTHGNLDNILNKSRASLEIV